MRTIRSLLQIPHCALIGILQIAIIRRRGEEIPFQKNAACNVVEWQDASVNNKAGQGQEPEDWSEFPNVRDVHFRFYCGGARCCGGWVIVFIENLCADSSFIDLSIDHLSVSQAMLVIILKQRNRQSPRVSSYSNLTKKVHTRSQPHSTQLCYTTYTESVT